MQPSWLYPPISGEIMPHPFQERNHAIESCTPRKVAQRIPLYRRRVITLDADVLPRDKEAKEVRLYPALLMTELRRC